MCAGMGSSCGWTWAAKKIPNGCKAEVRLSCNMTAAEAYVVSATRQQQDTMQLASPTSTTAIPCQVWLSTARSFLQRGMPIINVFCKCYVLTLHTLAKHIPLAMRQVLSTELTCCRNLSHTSLQAFAQQDALLAQCRWLVAMHICLMRTTSQHVTTPSRQHVSVCLAAIPGI